MSLSAKLAPKEPRLPGSTYPVDLKLKYAAPSIDPKEG